MNSSRKGISAYQKESKKQGTEPEVPADDGIKPGRKKKQGGKAGKQGAPEGFLKAGVSPWQPDAFDGRQGNAENLEFAAPQTAAEASTGTRKPSLSAEKINNGIDRASKFLMLLGKEDAAKVMRHLGKEEIEAVSRKIAETGRIDSEEASRILGEFGLIREKGQSYLGGPEVAKEMLIGAFGEEKGGRLFKKSVPHGGNKPFAFLNDYEFQQILMILKKEPPGVLGIVLNYLEPATASKVLEALTPEQQREVVKTIAVKRKIDSDVLMRMENVIKDKIRAQGRVVTEEVDGKSILADILKHVSTATEKEILGDLEIADPMLSEEIKERLFGVDSVLGLYDKDLQEVLRDYADDELALMLKAKQDAFREKILTNVSERRRQIIEEELAYMGSVKRKDVDTATKDFLRYLQNQAESGKIRLADADDSDQYV